MSSENPRPVIVKIDNSHYLLDRWRDWLVDAGFQVIRSRRYSEALRLAERTHPVLILIADEPGRGIDAIEWLELQHSHADSALAMIPLLVVARKKQANEVRLQELPDRVRVIVRPVDAQLLVETVRDLLEIWT